MANAIARMSENVTNSPDNNKRKNQVTNVIFMRLYLVTSIAIHISNIWEKQRRRIEPRNQTRTRKDQGYVI